MRNGRLKYFVTGTIIGLVLLLCFSSCLKEFPDSFPDEYEWKADIAFPIGHTTLGLKAENGFDSSLLEIDTLTGHSFWAQLPDIDIEGSFHFDFEEVLSKLDGIEVVRLRINMYNGFPVDFNMQAYMLDEHDEIIDSLFIPELTLKRGSVSAGGKTRTPSLTTRDVVFEGEGIYNLSAVRKIFISARIPTVPYFPEYSFSVQMGSVITYRTQFPIN